MLWHHSTACLSTACLSTSHHVAAHNSRPRHRPTPHSTSQDNTTHHIMSQHNTSYHSIAQHFTAHHSQSRHSTTHTAQNVSAHHVMSQQTASQTNTSQQSMPLTIHLIAVQHVTTQHVSMDPYAYAYDVSTWSLKFKSIVRGALFQGGSFWPISWSLESFNATLSVSLHHNGPEVPHPLWHRAGWGQWGLGRCLRSCMGASCTRWNGCPHTQRAAWSLHLF